MIDLRPYQSDAVHRIRQAYQSHPQRRHENTYY